MPVKPQLTAFYRSFVLEERVPSCRVRLCADSRYLLELNGQQLLRGPCRAPRGILYMDELNLAPYLQTGENRLLLYVLNVCNDPLEVNSFLTRGPSSVLTTGRGGVFLEELETQLGIQTGPSYWARTVEGYLVEEEQSAGYLGCYENVDGGRLPRTDDLAGWHPASIVARKENYTNYGMRNFWFRDSVRPIPYPFERELLFQGISRANGLTEMEAETLLRGEAIVLPPNRSVVIHLDAACYRTAYPVLVMEGGAGHQLTLTYAEGYGTIDEDGVFQKGIRDKAEGQVLRGAADRYLTGTGYQRYVPFFYRTFRFLKLKIVTADSPLILHRLCYRETGYPLSVDSTFAAGDPLFDRIWTTSLHTLECCMYETYMDCPYYEQMQYIMDAYLEICYTFCVSGDCRLAKKAIEDIAASQMADGMLPCNAPAKITQIIPVFSLYWILMLSVYYQYTGETEFVRKFLGKIDLLLDYFLLRIRPSDGLVGNTGYWQFFDWAEGFDRGCPVSGEEDVNILENMMYVLGLRQSAFLNQACGRAGMAAEYEERAQAVSASIVREAYCAEEGLFADLPGSRPFSRHAQIFAVLSGVVPEGEARDLLLRMLRQEKLTVPSYCMSFFECRALEATGLYRFSEPVWNSFEGLLEQHLTTWPEDFLSCRSDCHGWSALPLYEMIVCFLGIRPLRPGFDLVGVCPQPCPLKQYRGSVLLPAGRLSVAIEQEGQFRLHIRAPEGQALFVRMPSGKTYEYASGGEIMLEEELCRDERLTTALDNKLSI